MPSLDQFKSGAALLWVSGATVAQYAHVQSPADGQLYVRITATGSGATDPANDATNYRPAGGRAIKSIQRGVISQAFNVITATATITAVNTAKSQLRSLGISIGPGGGADQIATLDLTNATTITSSRNNNGYTAANSWELTEFY